MAAEAEASDPPEGSRTRAALRVQKLYGANGARKFNVVPSFLRNAARSGAIDFTHAEETLGRDC